MINNKENNTCFNCKKLEFLYENCYNNSIDQGEKMKYFFSLDSDSIVEMLNLRKKHQINDRLMSYFIMSYTNEKGSSISKKIGSKSLNNFLAEAWFSYFFEDHDKKNEFFLIVPAFTTDLVARIASVLPKNMVQKFYTDLVSYSSNFIKMIEQEEFYFIFEEKRKSSIGVVITEEVYFSDLVKNSVEAFYFSALFLFYKDLNIEDVKKKDLLKQADSYTEVVSLKNFYNSKMLSKFKEKEISKENDSIEKNDEETITIQDIFEKAKKIIVSKKRLKKENGAYECEDGSYRKPIQGKQLIVSKKNSSNAFTLVFLTLTIFTILGAFALSYADKADSSYTPIKESQISNDLSSIVQDNLKLKTLK